MNRYRDQSNMDEPSIPSKHVPQRHPQLLHHLIQPSDGVPYSIG